MASVEGGGQATKYLDEMAANLATASIVRAGFTEAAKYPDGTPMALAAAVNNFGAPARGIPPRPFFSTAVDRGRPVWGKQLGGLLKLDGWNARRALETMGQTMAGGIADALLDTTGPALSPVTLLLRARFPTRDGMTAADVWQAFRDVASGNIDKTTTSTGGRPLVWSGGMLKQLQGPQAYEVE